MGIVKNIYVENKLRQIIIFLIMLVAISIPFGYVSDIAKKINVIILILWILVVKIDDIKYILRQKVVIALFLFILIHYFTLPWSDNVREGLQEIRHLWRYIFIPIIIYATIIRKEDIKYIIHAFIATMFFNEILSYLIYFDLYQTEFSKVYKYPVAFMNHIQYSALVAFAAILILYQAKLMKNGLIRYVYVLFFITMTTNLVISGGRTGYVIFFTSLVILLFVYYKFTLKNFLQILVFPVAVFYIGYYFNSDVQARIENSFKDIEKINQESNYNTSFGQRIAFYPITYDILKQDDNSFIYGVGVGDLKQELKESIERTKLINVIHPHVHSSYLTAYLNSGIFGLILFILMWYYLFNIKIRNKEMRFIALLFPLNFSIGIIVDIFFTQYPMMVYFSIFVAIILAGEKADSVAIVHTQKDKNI